MASVKTWGQLEKALQQARDKALKGTGEKGVGVAKKKSRYRCIRNVKR